MKAITIFALAVGTMMPGFAAASTIIRIGEAANPYEARALILQGLKDYNEIVSLENAVEFSCTTLLKSYRFSRIDEDYPFEACASDATRLAKTVIAERNAETQRKDKIAELEEQAAASKKAAQQALEVRARNARLADVIAGRTKPLDISDLVAVSGALDGTSLPGSPKIKADGKRYALIGVIEIARTANNIVARQSDGPIPEVVRRVLGSAATTPNYFQLNVPPSMQSAFEENARIGKGLMVVGKYVDNFQFKTLAGQTRTMPVFQIDRLYWWQ